MMGYIQRKLQMSLSANGKSCIFKLAIAKICKLPPLTNFFRMHQMYERWSEQLPIHFCDNDLWGAARNSSNGSRGSIIKSLFLVANSSSNVTTLMSWAHESHKLRNEVIWGGGGHADTKFPHCESSLQEISALWMFSAGNHWKQMFYTR